MNIKGLKGVFLNEDFLEGSFLLSAPYYCGSSRMRFVQSFSLLQIRPRNVGSRLPHSFLYPSLSTNATFYPCQKKKCFEIWRKWHWFRKFCKKFYIFNQWSFTSLRFIFSYSWSMEQHKFRLFYYFFLFAHQLGVFKQTEWAKPGPILQVYFFFHISIALCSNFQYSSSIDFYTRFFITVI